jgi:hypothetical protein
MYTVACRRVLSSIPPFSTVPLLRSYPFKCYVFIEPLPGRRRWFNHDVRLSKHHKYKLFMMYIGSISLSLGYTAICYETSSLSEKQ